MSSFSAILQVIGGAGQSITLPLWLVYLDNTTPYFVLYFASAMFVVFFGITNIILRRSFKVKNHKALFINGFCDSLNGFFAVFSSPPSRTSLPIQSSMAMMIIPITILVRYIVLKKKPAKYQYVAVLFVIAGVLITMVPTIANFDEHGVNGRGHSSTFVRIFWPCAFIFSFVPAAVMNVYGEMTLKNDKTEISMFLFWTSLYQLITDTMLFWVDMIPGFGMSTFHSFWPNMANGFADTFTNGESAGLAALFIAFYIISYFGSNIVIQKDEGATWSAVIGNFASPICVVFWYLFKAQPFGWDPHFPLYALYVCGGTIMLSIASYYYKKYSDHNEHDNHELYDRTYLLA